MFSQFFTFRQLEKQNNSKFTFLLFFLLLFFFKKQVVHLKNNEVLIPSVGLYSMKSNRNSVADKQHFPISLSAAQ